MPTLLRRTIGALKDQTSIRLARLSASDLEVAVLKSTSHEELPVEERHLAEVLLLCSSSPLAAAACVRALSRRISRTHSWVVALKALVLASRLLRDGVPSFRHEAAASRGRRLLDLSSFRDASSPSPWDFTAFVRTFALYLDACLEAALLGKLDAGSLLRRRPSPSAGGKLPAILDQVVLWQRLLGRAISTRPTGPAKSSRLVHAALYPVVRETFDLYRGVSEGLSLLLDNFFRLQHATCLETFNACVTASKQFDELESFYRLCRKIGVGRTSEYPRVQKISDTLLNSLEGFSVNWQQDSGSPPAKHDIRSHLIDPWRKNLDIDQASDTARSGEKNTTGDCGSEFWDQTCSVGVHARGSSGSSSASSMGNSEKWITKDFAAVHGENDPRLQEWELSLIASVDGAFVNHANAHTNNPVQEPHDHQGMLQSGGKNLSIDQKPSYHNAPQRLHNPFVNGQQTSSPAIVPWSSSAAPLPTFRAGGPSDGSPAEAKISDDDSSRQQQVLNEQRLWMRQQSKILLSKNLA